MKHWRELPLRDQIVFVMAAKIAQRRPGADIAKQLHEPQISVLVELWKLRRDGLVFLRPTNPRYGQAGWSLTQAGNALRNRLTSQTHL